MQVVFATVLVNLASAKAWVMVEHGVSCQGRLVEMKTKIRSALAAWHRAWVHDRVNRCSGRRHL